MPPRQLVDLGVLGSAGLQPSRHTRRIRTSSRFIAMLRRSSAATSEVKASRQSSSPSSNQHKKVRFSWAVDLDATGVE